MSKRHKKKIHNNRVSYSFDTEKVLQALEASNEKIINEIKKNEIDFQEEPEKKVIEYAKKINLAINNGERYKPILKIIHVFAFAIMILLMIAIVVCAIDERNLSVLLVELPVLCFAAAEGVAIFSVKDKTDQEAYNSIMALIAVVSLLISLFSLL